MNTEEPPLNNYPLKTPQDYLKEIVIEVKAEDNLAKEVITWDESKKDWVRTPAE